MPGLYEPEQPAQGLLGLLGQTWPAKMAKGILGGLTLPGDVYAGRTTLNDPEYYNRASDLAGLVMGGTYAGAPAGAMGSGPVRRLPMDEASRMARAQEQGYTVDAYKGGFPYDWNTTPITNGKGEVIGNANSIPKELTEMKQPNSPHAGFYSDDPAVASRFAQVTSNQGAVFPTKLKFENPLVIDGKGKPAAAFQFDSIAREHGMQDALASYRKVFAADSKHDGLIVKNTKDEGTVYIPRNGNQVRSRFAAFDPAKADSGNLLASLLAGGVLAPQFLEQR